MIKNKHRFELFNRSPEACQLLFNTLLFSLPVFIIIWLPGVWLCFFCVLVLYNTHFSAGHYSSTVKQCYKVWLYKYMFYAYIAYFAFSSISVIFFNSPLKSIDNAAIFLIWLAVLPVFVILKPNSHVLGYGCLFAVVIAFCIAAIQFHFLAIDRPYGMYGAVFPGSGSIKFGDISLLMGIMSSIFLFKKQNRFLSFLGAFFGLIVCLYAGARGGIFALGLCWLAWLFFIKTKTMSIKTIFVWFILTTALFFIVDIITGRHISHRVSQTLAELVLFNNNNFNTSMGVRLQMWRAALILFKNAPLLGVGLNNFDDALLTLYKNHMVSKWVIIYSHAHNEYFCSLATGGIIGFIVTCSLLFIPIAWFKKNYGENIWTKAGFWYSLLLVFFALTDCIFDRRMTVMTFIIFTTVCVAGNIAFSATKTVKNIYR